LQCEEILAHTDEKINYRINTGNLPAGLYLVRAEPKNAGLKMGKSARLLVSNP